MTALDIVIGVCVGPGLIAFGLIGLRGAGRIGGRLEFFFLLMVIGGVAFLGMSAMYFLTEIWKLVAG